MFFFGLFTVGQFSFWGNYLPRVLSDSLARHWRKFCRQHRRPDDRHVLRAGDQHAGADNAGDKRMPLKMAAAALAVGTFAYVANIVLSFWLPEPQHAGTSRRVLIPHDRKNVNVGRTS